MANDSYTAENMKDDFEIPDEVLPLVLAHPRLLPGETRDEFYLMLELMFSWSSCSVRSWRILNSNG